MPALVVGAASLTVKRSARAAGEGATAEDLRADFLELLARFRFDHRGADQGRHPHFGNEASAVEDVDIVAVVDDARGEFRGLERAADQPRADLLLRHEPDLAQV